MVQRRNSPDPQVAAPIDPEQRAAWLAAKHHDTPAQVDLDTLGRPILSTEHNRIEQTDQSGNVTSTTDEFYQTQISLDIEGNARNIVDARGNTVMAYGYNMLGARVYENSMDAGERWALSNIAGNPMRAWDSRDHLVTSAYDILQRPLTLHVQGGDGDVVLDNIFERIIYGEGSPNDKANNLRGQMLSHYDTAGKVQSIGFDFKGNLLEGSRQFATDYKTVVDWQEGNLDADLEAEIFTNSMVYDALNRVTSSTTPDGSITTPSYNAANLLETVSVIQQGNTQLYVSNIDYDEKGQRQQITYGNGVTTSYDYDPQTFRLTQLQTQTASNEILQELFYTYDPVGNITEIEDRAIPTVFFDNQIIEPKSLYRYDSLYRLISASGKEHVAQIEHGLNDNFDDLPFLRNLNPGDPMAWRNYSQQYQYDGVGNILQMQHIANGGSWTRDYEYEADNNRLNNTTVGNSTYTYPHHEQHGFMNSMPHLSVMEWNFKDELQAVAQQVVNGGVPPETTFYVYDGSGERVRKVTENSGGASIKDERLYLGGVEIYRKRTGANAGLERITLHVMDDSSRIAMIDRRNGVDDGTDARTVRYQFGNHLGSAALEVDETGRVLSYEEYHPYGITAYQARDASVRMAAKRYRYTGMERDEETGFGYHGARYYLSWLGRWCAADPIGVGDGVNLYQYCKRAPVNHIDLDGEKYTKTVDPISKTITYSLKIYTISSETFEEATEVASTLNAFEGNMINDKGESYKVQFDIAVFAPPEADVLEEQFGMKLRFKYGKKSIREHKYQDAAQKWWLLYLKKSDNEGNLYLGENSPIKDVKDFVIDSFKQEILRHKNSITKSIRTATRSGNEEKAEEYRNKYRKFLKDEPNYLEYYRKRLNAGLSIGLPSESSAGEQFDSSEDTANSASLTTEVSRGTTYINTIIEMRRFRGGSDVEKHNVRLHEFFHLLGLPEFNEEYVESIMNYQFVKKNSNKKLTPQPFDISVLP